MERCDLTDLTVDSCGCPKHRDSAGFNATTRAVDGRQANPVEQEEVRRFALSLAESGAELPWTGYLEEITTRFEGATDPANIRGLWNQVSNQLNREGRLVDDPAIRDSPLRPASEYPHVRRLSVTDTINEIEHLIDSGGWTKDDRGLRLWMVAERIGTIAYVCVYDAMHEMNKRGRRIETRGQFWYVKP